jgi:biopolymer transport protein ExbB
MLRLIESGGPVMYPLIALSFLSVTIIVERVIFWMRTDRSRDKALVGRILKFVEEGDPAAAAGFGPNSSDFVARTLLNGLRHRFYSLALALETQAMIELKRMKRNIVILDTIITAAPLFGILGTVTGIIGAFNALGFEGVADPKAVCAGIAEALITTAYGLSVALITIFPYNYFSSRYEDAAEELEKYGSTIEMLMEKSKQDAIVRSITKDVADHENKKETY